MRSSMPLGSGTLGGVRSYPMPRIGGMPLTPTMHSGKSFIPPRIACNAADSNDGMSSDSSDSTATPSTQNKLNMFQRIQKYITGQRKIDKRLLARLGFGAFSAYGIISNINAVILITIAWVTVVKTTGGTPLLEANRARFLAIYGGLWISSHFMRPIRLSLAIALAPTMDKLMVMIQKRTGFNKAAAFGVLLGMIAIGSFSFLGLAIVWSQTFLLA